jgi:hypothetical protein
VKAKGLFWASLACLVGSLFLRLFNSLRLWKRVKEGKFFTFVLGVLVNLVEPNSGMELERQHLSTKKQAARDGIRDSKST